MDYIAKFPIWKCKVAYIAAEKCQGRIGGQVRAPSAESVRVAGEGCNFCAKVEKAVRIAEALDKPAAKEAGSTCNEEPMSTQFVPEAAGTCQNYLKFTPWYFKRHAPTPAMTNIYKDNVCSSRFD
jgi:hypothetical protein